jgi:hypothetical protein
MSKPKFLHEKKATTVVDGKRVTEEEFLIDGDKGLYIKYFSQEGDKKMKIIVKSKDGSYVLIISDGSDKGTEKELSHEELVKELSKHKHMAFATDYLKKNKKSKMSRMSRVSKKSSRKSSKKMSKRKSKKSSRK